MAIKKNYRKKKRNPRYNRRQWKPSAGMVLRPDYSTKAECGEQIIASNATLEYTGSVTFQLSEVLNATVYAQLWDQYRINYVTIKFIPIMTGEVTRPFDDVTGGNLTFATPMLYAVIDRDDNNTASSLEIRAKQAHRSNLSTKPMSWSFTPSTLSPVYTGPTSAFAYKVNNNKQWLDMAGRNIIHYGLKYAQETQQATNSFVYKIQKNCLLIIP